uniref:Uncharacterized protein n=1 Tax=Callorhinchus milii TaxID=7868 RepID=A0A4W3H8C6_CALMI
MKNKSWLRKNWLLVAGLTFLGIHTVTYIMQKAVKNSTQSSVEFKKNIDE